MTDGDKNAVAEGMIVPGFQTEEDSVNSGFSRKIYVTKLLGKNRTFWISSKKERFCVFDNHFHDKYNLMRVKLYIFYIEYKLYRILYRKIKIFITHLLTVFSRHFI